MNSLARIREGVLLVPLVAAGLAGTVAAVGARGADDAFLLRQKSPTIVSREAVEKLVLTAPNLEPPHESPGVASRCRARGQRELRNPWRCTVSYRSGNRIRLTVTIKPDGSYIGDYFGDQDARADGCCLRIPGAK